MNTKIAAILIAMIAVYSIISTVRLFRTGKLATRMFILWNFVWFFVGFFALFPSFLDVIVGLVDLHFRSSFLFMASTLFLMVLILHISASLSESQRKVARLVQEVAILRHELTRLTDAQQKDKARDEI